MFVTFIKEIKQLSVEEDKYFPCICPLANEKKKEFKSRLFVCGFQFWTKGIYQLE